MVTGMACVRAIWTQTAPGQLWGASSSGGWARLAELRSSRKDWYEFRRAKTLEWELRRNSTSGAHGCSERIWSSGTSHVDLEPDCRSHQRTREEGYDHAISVDGRSVGYRHAGACTVVCFGERRCRTATTTADAEPHAADGRQAAGNDGPARFGERARGRAVAADRAVGPRGDARREQRSAGLPRPDHGRGLGGVELLLEHQPPEFLGPGSVQ